MTLIFASIPEDNSPPILASDLLLTGGKSEAPDLPSGRNQEGSYVEAYSELCRKLYIITPHLAVLVAGVYLEVKNFLSELNTRVAENEGQKNIIKILDEVWGDYYRNSSVIALIYDSPTETVTSWVRGQIIETALPRLGKTWCAGTGAEHFISKINQDFNRPEEFIGSAPPDYKSLLRIITICQNIVASETLGCADGDFNLYYRYGGFMEFCIFSRRERRFYLTNNITILYWYIENSLNSPYKFYFGFAPQDENNPHNFHFYRTCYSENAFIIRRFRNISKTEAGHIVEREEYTVSNIIPSLNNYDAVTNGNFAVNTFEVPIQDPSRIPNRFIYTSYFNDKKWIKIVPYGSKYEAQITDFAYSESKGQVERFMNNRNQLISQLPNT